MFALPWGPRNPLTSALEKPDEGSSKRSVEDRVDDGVDGRGDVSQPQTRVRHGLRNVTGWARGEGSGEGDEG
jgi:hypothetical protein